MSGDELRSAAEAIINDLDGIARDYDHYEYGLPHDAEQRERMVSAILLRLLPPVDDGEPVVWTDEQCFRLNAGQHEHPDPFQARHPYTCGNDSRHRPLIATRQGWRCADCDYRQGWAHGIPLTPAGG